MVSMKKSPTALAITSTAPSAESLHNFETDPNDNKFTLKIEDPTMLKDSFFFLVLESNDPGSCFRSLTRINRERALWSWT